MKSSILFAALALSACTDVSKACPPFHPTAPYAPRISASDRELLEVNGEYAAYNAGLICGSIR